MQVWYNWNKIIHWIHFLTIFPTYFPHHNLLCEFPTRLFHSAPAICISDEPFQRSFSFSDTDVSQELFHEVTSAWSKDELDQVYFTEISFISCNNFLSQALSKRKIPKVSSSEKSLVGRFETKNWGSGLKQELKNKSKQL